MPILLLALCQFHILRLWRQQPRALLALAILVLASTGAVTVLLLEWEQANAAERELTGLRVKRESIAALGNADEAVTLAIPRLPDFQSAQFVAGLHKAAGESKLPLDEVSYVLDENLSQPYLRYRITMTVSSNYPTVRRFVGQLNARWPNTMLDAINCTRDDIAAAVLKCDLAISAVFRKASHG